MDETKNDQELPNSGESTNDVERGKGLAWLSYLGILWLVPLLAMKDNAFCKFHVKQGIILTILVFAVWIVGWIPFIGWFFLAVVYIYSLVMSIMGIINAASGKLWTMPVLGKLAADWFKF